MNCMKIAQTVISAIIVKIVAIAIIVAIVKIVILAISVTIVIIAQIVRAVKDAVIYTMHSACFMVSNIEQCV